MISRTYRSLWSWVFRPAARYPADPRAIFILALSVFAGMTALTLHVAPESLEALLPAWGLVVWGFSLTAGSALTLLGMALQTVNGIITEQVGSVVVGVAILFYSMLAFLTVGVSSLQSVGIVAAWGLACIIRWAQLQSLINHAYKVEVHSDLVEQIRSEIETESDR